MGQQLIWRFFSNQLFSSLSDGQRVRLGEEIGHELIVVVDWVVLDWIWLLWFSEAYEFHGRDPALMEELEEAVLSIGAGLAKIDNSSLVVDDISLGVHSFAVALHVQLLDVGRELAQGLAVGDDCSWGEALDGGPVKTNQTQ